MAMMGKGAGGNRPLHFEKLRVANLIPPRPSTFFSHKIEEIKNQFTAWGKRNLTIMGNILIIKTLILPKFTFLARKPLPPFS
jgi:hypothetical protein